MLPPSGDQYEIRGGGYRAVIAEAGATLRVLEHHGHPLLDGFAADEIASGARGQLLAPWPNRIGDGRFEFGGEVHQVPISEPEHRNALHGLVRWATWSLEDQGADCVSLTHRLLAQPGYPWTLDLRVTYSLSADGLRVTQSAVNRSTAPGPYASGAHPYLTVGPGPVDGWELTLPAATHLRVDDRLLPTGTEPVAGTAYDFHSARLIGELGFDDGFTDLKRDADGVATVMLADPTTGRAVALWVDDRHRWLQVFSADDVPGTARRSLAVEPMTAPPDAFRTGDDLVTLAPSGEPGDQLSATWGIRALA